MSDENTPKIDSIWKNKKSGELYQVYDYTNESADDERKDKYPVHISYRRISDETRWSRKLSDWHRSYDEVPKKLCSNKDASGSCMMHNLFCSFPKCEE